MVAVCSALVVSVAGLVTSVSGTADRVAAQVAGTADLEVAPAFSGGTVPDDVVDDVAALPGLAAAAPTVQSAVTVDATRALLVAGDARALPFLPPGLADAYAETAGTPPAEAGGEDTGAGPAVLVSVALADDAGLAAGDTVAVRGLTGVTDARVAGVLPEEVAGATVVADLTTGERLRGGGDGPDRLLLALDGDAAGAGGSERAVARRVDEVLAGRAVALDPARRGDAAAETLQPLLRPLLLLSGLTVTVAAVLVFNVVSLAVAERRRYLAIQCALGARRRRLWLGLVGEAALLGAVGGVVGAAVGRPLTGALIDQVPPALASAAVPTSIVTDVRWWVLLGGVGVGVAAAAAAAAAAGLPVVRLSPLEAMGPRDVVGEPAGPVRPLAVAVGAVAVIAGVVIVAVAPATLQLLAALVILNGRVALATGITDIQALRGQAKKVGGAYQVKLTDEARGKVVIGETTFLFQFVAPPPVQPRPQLPLAVKGGIASTIDWTLTIIAAFSFLLHFGIVGAMYSDWMDPVVGDDFNLAGLVDMMKNIPPPPVVEPTDTNPVATAT